MSPRFRNLLTHPKFWRIVGFVSSLIGTLCYAQSLISFQHVGDVKNHTLKISLYGVVSFTIIFVMLFARKGRFSKSFPLKALVGVLALMLTSLYNFFSDKDNNNKGPNDRKTDVFNLISNGSFALMLLSLSKQIDLGCEGELLSFYLGCLTIQLMKINMGFVLVGAAYCYLLNILHSYADSNSDYNEASCHEGHVAIEIDNAKGEERSEQQLYSILGVEIKSDDEGNVMYYYPEDLEAKLVEAIASGFEKEHCYNVFCRWRRQFLLQEELLLKQDLNIEGVQKFPLKYLKDEIENWNKASKVAFRTLFPYERQLCDRVFGFSHDPFADSSFMEICQEPTIHLLGFAKSVAKSTTRSSPERLFNMLLVFETLNHLLPDLKSVFSKEGDGVVLWNEAVRICKRLKGAIRVVFMELENMILHQDPSKVVVFGGGLHPINHYVMNYLFAASQFWKTLEIAFEDDDEGSSTSSTTTIPSSCGLLLLSLQVVKILEVLERNLKASSKIYKDSCLASVFMMNNWRYIVHKVKKCELRKVLGDEWVQRHVAEMGQYLVNYQRRSWDQVLGMLNSVADDDCDVAAESSMEVLKMKLGEICEMQGTWVVIDEKLREVMKSSLKKILLPAVEKFVARFQINDIDHVQQVDCGVVLDVAALVDKLFLGKDEHRSPRIIQPTWTIVLPNTQDLYEWRKYDEKKTLNSTYPRKYYRCIYKNDQGCRARKHVQQIQKNPKMYTTSYSGFHTCSVLYVLHKPP